LTVAITGWEGRNKNLLLNHFNLRDQPFGVTPDPRYFFPSKTHREALSGLLYGIDSGLGFIALTAEPGMGKTTILRMALDRLGNTAKTVFLFQVITGPSELFRALLIDLGEKDLPGTLIELEMRLKEILAKHSESGPRLVVILDEAQNLDDSVLEAIRMLSNFEASSHKFLQVILCGQQQLADRLATPELLRLSQRISIFATLKPLTRVETADYIEHRLKVAGYENSNPLFTPEAVSLIADYGDGIPRNINNICFNALSFGCALGRKVIDAEVVREAIVDLGLKGSRDAEPTEDQGTQGETFVEPILDPGVQEASYAETIEDPDVQGATFAEPIDDRDWQRARFAESVRDFGRDEYAFEGPEFSEERETSPGLRIALIAVVLVATALGIVGWNVSRSGGDHLPLMSQVTSWFHNSPPVKAQPQVPASGLSQAPASPHVDEPAQTSIRQRDESAAQAAAPSRADSSLQSAVPTETKPAKDATAQGPAVSQSSKSNHERTGAKLRTSRITIPHGGVEVIGARQGQSIAGICVERFNGCTMTLLNTIVELNPGIKDHDHLAGGQRIVLPFMPRHNK
jgi:type II secretory pathway predicted ATPase ExeA